MQTNTISTTGIPNLDPSCTPWEQRLNTLLNTGLRAGADLVEVSPPFDPTGATAFLGVSIMFELLCAMTG